MRIIRYLSMRLLSLEIVTTDTDTERRRNGGGKSPVTPQLSVSFICRCHDYSDRLSLTCDAELQTGSACALRKVSPTLLSVASIWEWSDDLYCESLRTASSKWGRLRWGESTYLTSSFLFWCVDRRCLSFFPLGIGFSTWRIREERRLVYDDSQAG